MKPRQVTMTKLSRIGESSREFDLAFWQSLPPSTRMAAVWEMTVFHHKLNKRPPDEQTQSNSYNSWINRKFGGVSLTKPFQGHSCGGRNPEHRVSLAKKSIIGTHAS